MNMHGSTVILFRTHEDNARNRERIDFLVKTSGLPVVVAFDESSGEQGFLDYPRLPVGAAVYEALGLGNDAKMAWRCGDYCYYAARAAYPEVKHFWLVEYDVLFSFKKASDFFSRFASMDDVDFVAGRLGPATARWGWAETMDPKDGPVYRSFFPVTRMSARAIDYCYQKRRDALAARNSDSGEWPNDEAFVPTTLSRGGFAVRDLNAASRVYNKATFNFLIPRSYEREVKLIRNRVVHPVLDAQELASKPHSTLPKTPLHTVNRHLKILWGR